MKLRIAALALALAFVATPTLGVSMGEACSPCCADMGAAMGEGAASESGLAPCAAEATACESTSSASRGESCCEAAPSTPVRETNRSVDPPSPSFFAATRPIPAPAAPRSPALRASSDLAFRTMPLRLSVVLLI